MPETASGAFTRGGLIFIALLFNSFQAFNELPTQMMGRAIIHKHKTFAFYRPSAAALAATIADAPNNMIQILVFDIIAYFMSGLYRSAGAFFSFYVTVLGGFFALAGFFRLLGTLCQNYDQASRLASVIITFMITYVRPRLRFSRTGSLTVFPCAVRLPHPYLRPTTLAVLDQLHQPSVRLFSFFDGGRCPGRARDSAKVVGCAVSCCPLPLQLLLLAWRSTDISFSRL